MIKNIYLRPKAKNLESLCARPTKNRAVLDDLMLKIFTEVEEKGDEALRKYTKQFDGYAPQELKIPEQVMLDARAQLSIELKSAIKTAYDNIYRFHSAQRSKDIEIETMPGVVCRQRAIPIDSIGLYIPGGTAPLFSTVLMLGIPAQIAGCTQIQLCTPPNKKGVVHPAIIYAASLCGITNILTIGGAQAIAAMSVGTASVRRVSKIFGPGNQYVTAAKSYAKNYHTDMDMPAGPSELLIYADDTAVPAFVAADLLSQAEHGADSQVVLVTESSNIVKAVNKELEQQIPKLSRRNYAASAIANSFAVVFESSTTAWDYINMYAPEHLIIASRTPDRYSSLVVNAGSVFLGNFCPESAGDYASGTNHTLPTDGWAKSYNGVNVDSFMKKITFQNISKAGLQSLGASIITMAEAEGLGAHAKAVSIRLNSEE